MSILPGNALLSGPEPGPRPGDRQKKQTQDFRKKDPISKFTVWVKNSFFYKLEGVYFKYDNIFWYSAINIPR